MEARIGLVGAAKAVGRKTAAVVVEREEGKRTAELHMHLLVVKGLRRPVLQGVMDVRTPGLPGVIVPGVEAGSLGIAEGRRIESAESAGCLFGTTLSRGAGADVLAAG